MTNKLKKLIYVVVVLIVCVGTLCACNNDDKVTGIPEEDGFYSIDEAYQNGWISKNDLKNIAYYYNIDYNQNQGNYLKDFTPQPKNPETLSEQTINAIKNSYLSLMLDIPELSTDYVLLNQYYGTYHSFIAIAIIDNYNVYDLLIESEHSVGGVMFYDYCSTDLRLWYKKS